jgi:hypothetical protein
VPSPFVRSFLGLVLLAVCIYSAPAVLGQESPYFVTYDHYLEEPGNLEIEYFSNYVTQRSGVIPGTGIPDPSRVGHDFLSYWAEFEYGATGWWTTEFYLDGQSTFGDSTVFSGFRWENRFRPLRHEHILNPVLYVEYEDVNGTDKIYKEIVGHDVEADAAEPNAVTRREHERELEFKLILSSSVKGWNISENIIAAKNLANEPWEFGYALGASRPLALKASATRCTFCRQNFIAGVEMYGGLGDRYSFGLKNTSHYVAPVIAWNLPSDWTVRLSTGFGLNDNSHRFLLRWGVSHEIAGFGEMIRSLFGGRK